MNFDGIVGPTHNYAGLSFGNVASSTHAGKTAKPKAAALQGLKKMKALTDRGYRQAVLPPQPRPDLSVARSLGFYGSNEQVVKGLHSKDKALFYKCCSASSMWTANAGTMAPRTDSLDSKTHFVVANLANKFHRAIEADFTYKVFAEVFSKSEFFRVSRALVSNTYLGDEGAANHTRFCKDYSDSGIHFFVYGWADRQGSLAPKKFPARQSLQASMAVSRLLGLEEKNCVFAQQNPDVIDLGVFHNDVISVGNQNFLFMHEEAFLNSEQVLSELDRALKAKTTELEVLQVSSSEVSVEECVKTYLFNSQLLQKENGKMLLVAPEESQKSKSVSRFLDRVLADASSRIDEVVFFDLRESMQNGGGPACLRNRIVLSEEEISAIGPRVFLNDSLYQRLCSWVEEFYEDEVDESLLFDFDFIQKNHRALKSLGEILDLTVLRDL